MINNDEKILQLFDHVIKDSILDSEQKNLLIYKKAVAISGFADEALMLNTLNPLINSKSLWKGLSLTLLGDYFFYKDDFLKAKEFYQRTLLEKDLSNYILGKARNKLELISNE